MHASASGNTTFFETLQITTPINELEDNHEND